MLCFGLPEGGVLEIFGDTLLVPGDGLPPVLVMSDQAGVHRELHPDEGQQLVDHLERLLCREAIEQTDETHLITKPESIMGAPALVDLVDVQCGQRRLLSARVAGLCQYSIVRYLVTSKLSVYAEAINFSLWP